MAFDSYFIETVLLLHCDGSNGSTTFTDQKGKTVTAYGAAQISTAQSKFGGASAVFDGASSYVGVADSADFAMGGDFTMECWLYVDATTPAWSRLIETEAYNVAGGWGLRFNGSDASGSRRLGFQASQTGGGGGTIESNSAFPTGAWTHYALVRSAGVVSQYIAGVKQTATLATTEVYTAQKFRAGATIGTAANFYKGHIDDLRVTKGVARYTADFTPTTAAFPDVSAKLSGTTKDASGSLAQKLVRAYRQDTGAMVAQVVSDAGTGAFSLDVNGDYVYYITEHDTTSLTMAGSETANAAILDSLIPV